jgi:hypothetical protein
MAQRLRLSHELHEGTVQNHEQVPRIPKDTKIKTRLKKHQLYSQATGISRSINQNDCIIQSNGENGLSPCFGVLEYSRNLLVYLDRVIRGVRDLVCVLVQLEF